MGHRGGESLRGRPSPSSKWVRARPLGARAARGVALGVVAVVLLSGLAQASPGSPSTPPTSIAAARPHPAAVSPLATSPTNLTLKVGGLTGTLSPLFWGTTVNNEVHMLHGETEAVNATPAHVLVWPGANAGEDYDPLTNTHYDTYSGSPKTALASESQFVQMCETIHCTAIVQLPAEIDSPSYAEKIVNYTEVNLSFHPAYWMIGNEPELWSHWKVAWKNWPTTYTNGPTPTQFGQEVVQYVKAIRQVDNTTPIFGLPASGCTCGYWTFAQWIAAVLNVTGDQIQAVAFHEYPAGWLGTGDGSLYDFYATINGAASIPSRIVSARAAATSSCKGCNVSVFVSELGSALSWSAYGQYAAGFSGDLSLAAQITQAMDVNITNIDLFATELATSNSWFNSTGYARPDYALYTQIFDHLGTQVHPVNFTGSAGSVYGIDTVAPSDHARQDLMVVNANITKSVSFTPAFSTSTNGSPVEAYYWNGTIHNTASNATTWVEPYTPNPVAQEFPTGLPTTYTLPPQSMVLFEGFPGPATFVNLTAVNVPSNTPWYPIVGSRLYETTASNLSLLLPPGATPLSGAPLPLPIGGKEAIPSERLAPFPPNPLVVEGAAMNVSVPYATQWRLNVSADPIGSGNVTPEVGWWNASQPLTLTAEPAAGYALTQWTGWGPGSFNGSGRSVTIAPTGRVDETAHFVFGTPALFLAYGLPYGANWSVTIRGFTTNSSSSTLTVYEPPGVYGFHASTIPGYRTIPENGSFSPTGGTTIVRYVLITPPPPAFRVTVTTTGLPAWLTVPVTVRGVTQVVGGSPGEYSLINGTYAYDVGYVPGYHVVAPLKLFDVAGGPLQVVLTFVPTVYRVSWEAQGVRANLSWSIDVTGAPMGATSAWVSTNETNGTYGYTVQVPANYTVSPRNGVVAVNGSDVAVPLTVSLALYAAGFTATGPGASAVWSVRLGNSTVNGPGSGSGFTLPNGTYTFDVHPPTGMYAVPSHGNLTVAGPTPLVVVRFYPVSLQPSAALVAQLTSGGVLVSAWIVLAGAIGYGAVRLARRRGV